MRDTTQETLRAGPGGHLFIARLLIGLLQGLALYLLLHVALERSDIAIMPQWFPLLLLVTLFIPPALIVSIGRTSGVRVALWACVMVGVVAILGWHDAWRAVNTNVEGLLPFGRTPHAYYPSPGVTLVTGVIVFTAYCLILASESTKWRLAPYGAYFEISWKLGLQVCLAGLFVVAVFLVLWLGSELFLLLKLHFLEHLLHQKWFNMIVSAVAFATALHITDVRPEIIRGSRTLALSLLSWLLLIHVVIVGGFLAALPFTGLELLWATRSATWILLGVAAIKIILINAAFKGGPGLEPSPERPPHVLRICMRISCLMLLPLVTLAAYALALRVAQYGLTPRRIFACAGVFVGYCYAIGYTRAAIARTNTLAQIAPVNVLTAWVSLVALVALSTPPADPSRLAVASQVNRLLSGRVAPEQFDFDFLRYRSNRYGLQALTRLQKEQKAPNAAAIRALSTQSKRDLARGRLDRGAPDAGQRALDIVSLTPGEPVPASFLSQDWKRAPQHWTFPACLNVGTLQCDAYLIDLTGDRKRNVVLFPNHGSMGYVFGKGSENRDDSDNRENRDNGDWKMIGKFSIAPECDSVRDALAKGAFQLLAPRLQDIQINGKRIELETTPVPEGTCSISGIVAPLKGSLASTP